jgi:precorrin-2/cobalt-factor-2 C20-methyltransferase
LKTKSKDKCPGTFYGIGVGPGDPELITLKAKRILAEVPVIFVPKKGEESTSYARSIIAGFIQPHQQVVELVFPMLKERERLAGHWELAVERIWEHLGQGLDCAFVNLGDPLLYGTFINIIEALRSKCPQMHIQVIPGVSSITAAAAGAIIPLAIDDDRLAIISGKCDDSFIRETLNKFDTVIFMKMYRVFDRVLAILEETQLIKNAVYVENCTTGKERIVTDLTRLKGEKLDYFSLLIVRK